MANSLYGKGREGFLNGDIDWLVDDIRVILIDTNDYVVSIDADNALDDIPAAARTAVSAPLGTKATTLGVANAAGVTFAAAIGDVSEALVIYKHTGTESTSLLIAYIDTATGLPVVPNGGDIAITWDTGANKIFKL
jgi:hypothetical protein